MYINPNMKLHGDDFSKYQASVEELLKRGVSMEVAAGDNILTEGHTCEFIFYVESGMFRTLRFVNEKEVILGFTFKGDLDTCPHSFLYGLPGKDTIQAISRSRVIRVHRDHFETLAQTFPGFKDFMIHLLSTYAETLAQRFVEFKAETAESRYLELLKRQPVEGRSIPVQDLASYLGISRERLSRIRKKHPDLI